MVRFESREAAARNSTRPEQGEWWGRMEQCFDGEVMFHDCDNSMMFLDGGSDDAGFVQVIQGRLEDPERFRHFMEQPMDMLHEQRPEIIGGTIAIDADGWFTETISFRSEAEAREGEQKEMPEAAAQRVRGGDGPGDGTCATSTCTHPWFSSALRQRDVDRAEGSEVEQHSSSAGQPRRRVHQGPTWRWGSARPGPVR